MRLVLILGLCVLLQGCATNKKSIYTTILSAAAAGAVAGFNNAPKGENPDAHAQLWASGFAALGAVTAINVFDEEENSKNLDLKLKQVQSDFDSYKQEFGPKVEKSGASLIGSRIPKNLRGIVEPGSWELYKLDRWVKSEEDENTWFRQTQMFKVNLPITND